MDKTGKKTFVMRLDGVDVAAEQGQSVLDVARANGVWIPTLCHNESIEDYGACRLCLVEVARRGKRKVTASCTLPASPGLEIITVSERLAKLRGLVMELILASAPNTPAIREMAAKLGARPGRLVPNQKNDCILCGLCVRACREISKAEAITFSNRGAERRVGAPFQTASDRCILCGACVSVCPTGSRLLNLAQIAGEAPQALLSQFDAGMVRARAVGRSFPQAVPNVPAINPAACLKLNRDACGICERVCEAKAIRYDDADTTRELSVGAIVAAPGFETFVPNHDFGLGYTSNPDVLTSMEFERVLSASGPFGGHVRRPSDGREPRRIAFIQCVGSRDLSCRNAYCSSVCCMYAVKEAIIAREHSRDVESVVFVMDIRAFGKDFDSFVERARHEHKISFVYARVSDVIRDEATGANIVVYADEAGRIKREPFDLVTLSVGMEPSARFQSLAAALGVRRDSFGFMATAPFQPLRVSRKGVFAAGAATGPKDIPETVIQASAAACEAARFLAKNRGTLVAERAYPPERNLAGEPVRIGVFVCHCGINIGSVVNVRAVRDFAAALPGVAYADQNLYTCSQDTQKLMKERILEHRLNRVVVASCSPRTHEALFQETLREAGLNPYLFVMANIRDQCSWVHQREPEKATEKACDLVAMAVSKARLVEPLQPVKLPVTPAALVLGAGLAGMVAAEALADQGFEVKLVEQSGELGGNLKLLNTTIEGNDLRALKRDTEARVRAHPRIALRTGVTLSEIKGFVGNYESVLSDGTTWKHGAVIVATGAKPYQPREFGYGEIANVMTQLELDERLEKERHCPAPAHVVMIQCVGSREDARPYCSRVCCSKAVLNAIRLKERFPGAQVTVLYRDMRTYALRETYYAKARDMGVMFLRFDLDHRPRIEPENNKIPVIVFDPIMNRELRLDADWLVLSAGIVAQTEANDALAKQLKVPLNPNGFFLEAHVKLRPVEFATEGVFLAGLAHGPKTTDESIAQALAAASRAGVLLSRKELEASGAISAVDTERCMACGLCENVCAFGAITMGNVRIGAKEKFAAQVNPALCKGCGACSASCRSGAAALRGFTDEQVLAEIAAL